MCAFQKNDYPSTSVIFFNCIIALAHHKFRKELEYKKNTIQNLTEVTCQSVST